MAAKMAINDHDCVLNARLNGIGVTVFIYDGHTIYVFMVNDFILAVTIFTEYFLNA